MELKDLKDTLAELETNLQNLDAARKQVEKVTKSSDSLTNVTTSLLDKINSLYETLDKQTFNDFSNVLEDFSSAINKYETRINKILENSSKDTIKQVENIKVIRKKLNEQVEEIILSYNSNSNELLKKHSDDFDALTNNFKSGIENSIIKFENEILIKIKDNIDNKLEVYEKQNKLIKNLLFISIGISAIGIGIIIFLIK